MAYSSGTTQAAGKADPTNGWVVIDNNTPPDTNYYGNSYDGNGTTVGLDWGPGDAAYNFNLTIGDGSYWDYGTTTSILTATNNAWTNVLTASAVQSFAGTATSVATLSGEITMANMLGQPFATQPQVTKLFTQSSLTALTSIAADQSVMSASATRVKMAVTMTAGQPFKIPLPAACAFGRL